MHFLRKAALLPPARRAAETEALSPPPPPLIYALAMSISGGRPDQEPRPLEDALDSEVPRSSSSTKRSTSSLTPPPSMGPESDDPVRDALVVTRRYGATLNALLSAVDQFARGVESVRGANESLARKLERAQAHTRNELDAARRFELEHRVALLERQLKSERQTFEEEWRYLTEDQEAFLRMLLGEHDEELRRLRDERDALQNECATLRAQSPEAEKHTKPSESETDGAQPWLVESLRRQLETLRAERENTRALVQRMRAQRDEAQASLRRLQSLALSVRPAASTHPTTPAPPSFASGSDLEVPPAPRAPLDLAESLDRRLGDFPGDKRTS